MWQILTFCKLAELGTTNQLSCCALRPNSFMFWIVHGGGAAVSVVFLSVKYMTYTPCLFTNWTILNEGVSLVISSVRLSPPCSSSALKTKKDTQLWRHFPTMHGDARELHEAGSVTRLWESCLHLYSLFSFSSLLLVGVVFEWETRYNVHWLKFLEQQFAGVRNLQRRDVVWWLTVMTPWKKKRQILNCITLLLS